MIEQTKSLPSSQPDVSINGNGECAHRQPPHDMSLQNPHGSAEKSQHGTDIFLDKAHPHLVGQPLEINGKSITPDNPDRFKQHGFHFHADNCIACHACESACSEKNNLPPHLAFRKVGSIEGGTYPNVTRINISMACNHCEDPVCLKGCPTLAYTKYLEYGAVLQDPDICFGCGYCTWVCPYNAPQLDPVKGQVEKCNMCVDRLEVGLKPACVSACLGNALEFGVIEDIPNGRTEATLNIPGFPDPEVSRPNIRFQQTRPLPDTFSTVDTQPFHYRRGGLSKDKTDRFTVMPSNRKKPIGWGLDRLRSREDSLVIFTLASQFVVGAFLLLFLLPRFSPVIGSLLTQDVHPWTLAVTVLGLVCVQIFAFVLSTLHLGKPQYFYRAINNLRHSWVSREISAMGVFFDFMAAYALVTTFPVLTAWLTDELTGVLHVILGWGASIFGLIGLYCMYRCYRIKARPFWDHWHSGGAFFSSMLILGSLFLGVVFGVAEMMTGHSVASLLSSLAFPLFVGLILQGVALYRHARDMKQQGGEGAVSQMLLLEDYGKTYRARWMTWMVLTTGALIFAILAPEGNGSLAIWCLLFLLSVLHEVIGRALFYVLVVPMTTPKAFFWGNQTFEAHAQKTGLAKFPQVGVAAAKH